MEDTCRSGPRLDHSTTAYMSNLLDMEQREEQG